MAPTHGRTRTTLPIQSPPLERRDFCKSFPSMSIIFYILPSRRQDLSPRSAETFLHLCLSELDLLRYITLIRNLGILWPYSTSLTHVNRILRFTVFGSTILIFHTLRAQRLLNPPESAYRSETGGLMAALRKLSVEQSNGFLCSSQTHH